MILEVRCPNCNRLLGKNFEGTIEIVCRCHHFKKWQEPLDKPDEV